MPSPSPQPPSSPTLRERKGGIVLLTFLPLLPRCGRGRGRLCSSPSSCCSHAAGEEGGIVLLTFLLLLPRCGRGRGEIVLLTFLLLLPRCGRGGGRLCCSPSSCCSHAAGEEGGDEQSKGDPAPVNDTAFTNQITPLPHCGRGAGGESGPSRNGCASTVRAQ